MSKPKEKGRVAALAAALSAEKVDRSTLPRVLITTDLEVDDQNGILLTLLFADQFDLAGIVWTAGMFHFNGDGIHTLAEITPHYRCEATTAGGTVENAGQLKSYRPVDPGLLTRLIDVSYRADYEFLSRNSPNYPTPDELLGIAKTGNVEFEGDYRFETEGSELIKSCILDDDPRPLCIQHWGGINTTVRALISIYEQYHDTPEWDSVRDKVVAKVRLDRSGEDHCRADSRIDELFPGLQDYDWHGYGNYGNYFQAAPAGKYRAKMKMGEREIEIPLGTNERLNPYYRGEYLKKAIKFDHGQLLTQFHLMNDGQVIYGEPLCFQYGLMKYVDLTETSRQGFGNITDWPRVELDTFDWMCCQFETCKFIDLGLRWDVKNRDDRFVIALFDELAARAEWAVRPPEACNHAPRIEVRQRDITARAGETVSVEAAVSDPDGDAVEVCWWMKAEDDPCPEQEDAGASSLHGLAASFTIPADARPGDRYVITAEARDDAELPMTRYAQIVVKVDG